VLRQIFVLGSILLLGAPTLASDGVIEINQAQALAGGITAGDAPGFPITLSLQGSYLLTSNLQVPSPGINAIEITADAVTVDLGGFAVIGTGSCTGFGSSLACTGGGNSSGVLSFATSVRIHGGSIRRFGSFGVLLGGASQADALRVGENGNNGVNASSGSLVSDVIASRNGGAGISVSESVVSGCVAFQNFGVGINGFSSSISDSLVSGNGSHGITAQQSSVLKDNVVRNNGGQGISSSGGVVRNNAVEFSGADGIVARSAVVVGNTSVLNAQAGIASLAAAAVQANLVRSNTGVGIYLVPELGGPAAAYSGNVVVSGPAGSVTSGVNPGGNSCNGAASCP
jgi:hypothetical protein